MECWLSRRSGHHRRAPVLLDPARDSELARLPQAKVREKFISYVKLRAAEPSEDVDPTLEQVSAVHQVITAGLVSFADFRVGRSARQEAFAQAHLSQLDLDARTWQRKELPEPPSFYSVGTWHLLISWATTEKWVRSQLSLYDDAWFVVYKADVRMRSEQFERWRRRVEWGHPSVGSAGSTTKLRPRQAVGGSVRDGFVPGRHCVVVGSPSVAKRVIPIRGGTPSRLLSDIRSKSMGSWSPVRGSTVCSRPESNADAPPLCLLAERTAEVCSIVRSWWRISCSTGTLLPAFPYLFDLALCVELARR